MKKLLARLVLPAVAVAGLTVVATPAPHAEACRPLAGSPAVSYCDTLNDQRPKPKKCRRPGQKPPLWCYRPNVWRR